MNNLHLTKEAHKMRLEKDNARVMKEFHQMMEAEFLEYKETMKKLQNQKSKKSARQSKIKLDN